LADQQAQEERESERKQIDADEASNRATEQSQTDALKAEDAAYVDKSSSESAKDISDEEADASEDEDNIEGDEGLNNKMTDVEADWATQHYDRRTDNSQSTIDDAAAGAYPAGDWPVGPGDSPAAAADKADYAFGESLAQIPNEADGVPTPIHDDNAISDSEPAGLDAGQVDAAFSTNADKIKSAIESKAADSIDFDNNQRLERKANDAAANAAVSKNEEAVSNAQAADNAAVAKAQAERQEIEDAAATRVKDAEENAEEDEAPKTTQQVFGEEDGEDAEEDVEGFQTPAAATEEYA
jgi:hypothetical protein